MPITAHEVVEIANVEVNDATRVELRQIRRRTDYSPDEARELAHDLIAAADEVDRITLQTVTEMFDRNAGKAPGFDVDEAAGR